MSIQKFKILIENNSLPTISQFKIIITPVLRFSFISLKTSGFSICINSLGPKPSTPSVLNCLAKPLNALAVWLILSWILFFNNLSLIFLPRSSSSPLDTLIFGITLRVAYGLFLNPSISSISLISLLLCLFTSTRGLAWTYLVGVRSGA